MREIVGRIGDGKVVLPVIQRRLVWETDKMEALFDSLFQQNAFGSIKVSTSCSPTQIAPENL